MSGTKPSWLPSTVQVNKQIADAREEVLSVVPNDGRTLRVKNIISVAHAALRQALAISANLKGNVRLMDWKSERLEIVAQRGFSGGVALPFYPKRPVMNRCVRKSRGNTKMSRTVPNSAISPRYMKPA